MSEYRSLVKKDGDKYRVFYSYISPKDGKRHRTCKRGFKLRKDADKWAANELPALIRKLEQKQSDTEGMTMSELIEEYLEDARLDEEIEETTMATKNSCINNHILPYFKEKLILELKARDIKDWQRHLKGITLPNGKPYSQTYLRTIENQLSAIFNYAVLYYDLPKNPIAKRMGSKDAPEATIWTVDMYRKFQKHIEDKPAFYYAFEVFFWCGVRLGELLAITPNDIDFEGKVLNINKSMKLLDGKLTAGKTKTLSSVRKIALPDYLLDELREYLDSIGHYDDYTRIFPLSKTSIHSVIDKYSEVAGVPRITIHALRHSHASLLENIGVPLTSIKRRLGHATKDKKDVTTTYTHSYDSSDVMVARLLNAVALGDINPNNLFESLLKSNGIGVNAVV